MVNYHIPKISLKKSEKKNLKIKKKIKKNQKKIKKNNNHT
jgi:hypothetical protein